VSQSIFKSSFWAYFCDLLLPKFAVRTGCVIPFSSLTRHATCMYLLTLTYSFTQLDYDKAIFSWAELCVRNRQIYCTYLWLVIFYNNKCLCSLVGIVTKRRKKLQRNYFHFRQRQAIFRFSEAFVLPLSSTQPPFFVGKQDPPPEVSPSILEDPPVPRVKRSVGTSVLPLILM